MDLISILIIAGSGFVGLVFLGFIVARLYRRSSKEIAFVRTGFGGEKVIMDGGALVLPILHETIQVNMNTMRLEVRRANDQAIITKDRMRVDIAAEFFLRVKKDKESISTAAQTLGGKTNDANKLKELIEGKFVDSLRSVASEMDMEELHEKRSEFVQKAQTILLEDLAKNGLELETVSLTSLDQTDARYFNEENTFDAEGLTKLKAKTEKKRQERNEIERNTEIAINQKNLETTRKNLEIARDEEQAKLEQEKDIEIRKATQQTEIANEQARQKQEAENARIEAEKLIALQEVQKQKEIEQQQVLKDRKIEETRIESEKAVEIAKQQKAISLAEQSKKESEAKAEADRARAQAVAESENVITVQKTAEAEREKTMQLIKARENAEKQSIALTVQAEAEKKAAIDKAEAVKIEAQANADKLTVEAKGQADAEILLAQAQEKQYEVKAEGERKVHEAANVLSQAQIDMQIKIQLIQTLPSIIQASTKPLENIEGIKLIQVNGLTGGVANGVAGENTENQQAQGNLISQAVNGALAFRAQAPIVDNLLNEIGVVGGNIDSYLAPLTKTNPALEKAKAVDK